MKRMVCLLSCLILISMLTMTVRADETDAYAIKMLQYYQHYQLEAKPEIEHYLALMEEENPAQAAKWRKIMDLWIWTDTQMPVYEDVLPDGLPEDDSLCIVVLGFGLTRNGAMKPELIDRLEVAQASSEKYPNAWILLTGGETAHIRGVSEAGEMQSWLVARGVDANRILTDMEALSTTENARNSCRILSEYPNVNTIAVVTSDYHCRWGASLLAVAAWLEQGDHLQVACASCCRADNQGYDSYYSQAWGIATLAGIEWRRESAPELYLSQETVPAETAIQKAMESMRAVPEEEDTKWNPVWIVLFAVPVGIFLMTRKKKKPLS